MKEKNIFGLSRNVFVLGLTSLFNDFSSEMIYSIMPAFFVSVLKAGAASLGLVEGLAEATANAMKIYSGAASDRINRRKIFAVLGYSLSVITRPFYILVSSVGGVVGLRVLDRVGKGLREAPRDVLISFSVSPEESGKSFGYHRAMDTTGAILGPLVAYLLLRLFPDSFNLVFESAFIVGLIALATLALVKEVEKTAAVLKNNGGVGWKSFSKKFKIFLASIFCLSAGTLPVTVLLLKTEDIGLMIASIPLFYMVNNIFYAAFSYKAGKISDKIGTEKVILVGYLLLVVSYLVFIFSESILVLGFGFVILGLFSALTDGVQRSFTALHTELSSRGAGFGFFNASLGFGALVSGIAGGFIWQTFGSVYALVVSALTVAIGLLIFIVGTKLNDRKSEIRPEKI